MQRQRAPDPPPVEPKVFASAEEIDFAIMKLRRRLTELDALDIPAAVLSDTGADGVFESNLRESIREVFGQNSPEFREHEYIRVWAGPMFVNMGKREIIEGKERGRTQLRGILQGLISRMEEKKEDEFSGRGGTGRRTTLSSLKLHPRISEVAADLFDDGHHWEAVFAAAKALVNYVKDRSGRQELDGANLMRTAFSKNNPLLAFNDLSDQTDQDEQEGMMHLFEGAVLAIRNPGGHSFPEGSEERALEYISLLSLLAFRLQEARRPK